ncbi:hypothetical protein [Sphingobacterium athyrii]|uniref:Outer membrane protein beta-barrel domain-containing protein n=1 Tax=Sphingobacterium athyrii TaxID=2152717 RepID=A0A363NSF5_9SPHI|nr:hypothetical protein [Sphingobacterium athyrii]PUV23650.1 hypothetical protein DCO56_17330 [Sphingobacterium athyrii]
MKYIVSILLTLCVTNLIAQEKDNKIKYLPFEVIYFGGVQFNNASNLNKILMQEGAGKLPGFGWNAGAGVAYRMKQMLIGGSFSLSTNSKKDNTLNTGDIILYVATNAVHTGNLILSPQLGLGSQWSTFTIQKHNQSGSFDDFLTTQSNQTKMEHNSAIVDFNITLKSMNKNRTIFYPECRVGYKSSITKNDWKLIGTKATDVPADRLGSFYAQLAWGIGR